MAVENVCQKYPSQNADKKYQEKVPLKQPYRNAAQKTAA